MNRIKFVDDIKYVGDSIHVVMPFFDSEFMFKAHADSLHGYWKKNLANSSVRMPFVAYKNTKRFPEVIAISTKKFDGTWATYFINANKDTSFAIAEFKSVNDKIYGTFLSSTGDDRYLEGVSDGKKLWLSSFDGSHAYRYEMEVSADGKSILNGKLTYLSEDFDVHHINQNKQDNRIENLMLVDPLTHKRIHSGCILIDNEWWKPCRKCNKLKKVDIDYYKYKYENSILSWCKQCSITNVIKNKKKRNELKKIK